MAKLRYKVTLTSKNIITLGSDSWRLRKYENISLNKRTSSQDGIRDLETNHNRPCVTYNPQKVIKLCGTQRLRATQIQTQLHVGPRL